MLCYNLSITRKLFQPRILNGGDFVKNVEIRYAYMRAGIKQWQLAVALGISETHLSKKLRFELSQEEKNRILGVIDRLAQEKEAS